MIFSISCVFSFSQNTNRKLKIFKCAESRDTLVDAVARWARKHRNTIRSPQNSFVVSSPQPHCLHRRYRCLHTISFMRQCAQALQSISCCAIALHHRFACTLHRARCPSLSIHWIPFSDWITMVIFVCNFAQFFSRLFRFKWENMPSENISRAINAVTCRDSVSLWQL